MPRFRHPRLLLVASLLFAAALVAYVLTRSGDAPGPPDADALWPGTAAWAEEQLQAMTLEEKVSQLFSVRAYGRATDPDDPAYQALVALVDEFGLGGVAFFQGNPADQVALVNDLQGRAKWPLLIGQDMEWGAGMRVDSATIFPRAMAMGAAGNVEWARMAGYVTGREARALGVQHVFAPVADVNNNPDNPVINTRSFGEQPERVAEMAAAFAAGLQEAGVLATAKHFPGHGDTSVDSHTALPVLLFGTERLQALELVPFRKLVQEGVMSVMIAHLALPLVEPDSTLPASLSPQVATGLLRGELGFDGLVVTDALDMAGVTDHFSTEEIAVRALQAGADMLLLSEDPWAARDAVLQAIAAGELPAERIDAAVLRILRAKAWAGLPENRYVAGAAGSLRVNTPEHRALSLGMARESLTLLRNRGKMLPLARNARLLCITLADGTDPAAGRRFVADLLRNLPAAEVDTLRLDDASTLEDYEAALEAAADYPFVVVSAFLRARPRPEAVVQGEGEGNGPHSPQNAFLARLAERGWYPTDNPGVFRMDRSVFLSRLVEHGAPVALVSFGDPYIARDIVQPAAYLVAYSASEASQTAAADAMAGHADIRGRLPVGIPGLYAFGDGIDLAQQRVRLGYPAEAGLNGAVIARLDTLIQHAIDSTAFPGAALAIGRGGVIAKMDAYGHFTYREARPVATTSLFDLASLTKVIATTTAAMQLFDAGKLELDAPVADYLPRFRQSGKERVTVRHLLTHTAGLIPFRRFYATGTVRREALIDSVLAESLIYEPGTEMRYSDFSMIALMLAIERITGQPFDEYAEQHIFEPLGMRNTGFMPSGTPNRDAVPTERDHVFRRRLVQGEVHDENAWILGGVSGHAGLFSTVEDLARFAHMLVDDGHANGEPFISPETIRLFTTVQNPQISTRALGWDTKSPEGYSSAGVGFGSASFGHTGFTGTSFWVDPDTDLFVILLTNRVYPSRNNGMIQKIRPRVADQASGAVLGPPIFTLPDSVFAK